MTNDTAQSSTGSSDDTTFALFLAEPASAPLGLSAGDGIETPHYSADAVKQALQGDRPCAIVWQSLNATLAAAVHAGQRPGAYLEEWQAMAEAVLELFRTNRRKLVLIGADLFSEAATGQDRDRLADRLGRPVAVTAPPPSADPLARTLADLAVGRLEAVRDLLDELTASSLVPETPEFDVADLDAAAGILSTLQQELESSRTRLDEQQDVTRTLTQEAETLRAEADRHLRQIREQQDAMATLEADHRKQKDAMAETGEVRLLRDHIAELEKQIADDLTHAAGPDNEEIKLLRDQVAQLNAQIADDLARPVAPGPDSADKPDTTHDDKALARALAQARQDAEARATLEHELQRVKDRLAAREGNATQLAAAQSHVARLMAEGASLLDTIAAQKAAYAEQTERRAALERQAKQRADQITRLEGELAAAQGHVARLMAEGTSQLEIIAAQKDAYEQQAADLERLAGDAKEQNETCAALERQLEQRAEQIARLEGELATLTDQRAEDKRQRDTLASELEAAQAHGQTLSQQVEDLDMERARLLESTSWRVTKPLRRARLMISKPTRPKDE